MARPKRFEDPVTFQVRCERALLDRLTELAKSAGQDRNDFVLACLARAVSTPVAAFPAEVPKLLSPTPTPDVSPIPNCPHKYPVLRAGEWVCAACRKPVVR